VNREIDLPGQDYDDDDQPGAKIGFQVQKLQIPKGSSVDEGLTEKE
jgi:hypothetical protein